MNKELNGKKWCDLTPSEKEHMLKIASPVDARTCNRPECECECIIDFFGYDFSISGFVNEYGEITIDDSAKFYNPAE